MRLNPLRAAALAVTALALVAVAAGARQQVPLAKEATAPSPPAKTKPAQTAPAPNPNAPVLAYIHKKVDVTGVVYHRSEAWGIVINKVALHEQRPAAGEKASAGSESGKAAAATGAPAGK